MKPKMALSFAKCERNVQVIQHHYSQCALHNITTSAGCYVVLGFFSPSEHPRQWQERCGTLPKRATGDHFINFTSRVRKTRDTPSGTNCV